MTMYLIRRLGRALITLVLVTIITFTVLYTIPANIGWILLGRHATLAKAAALNKKLGLTLPLPVQYVRWLALLIEGGGLLRSLSLVAPPTLEYLGLAVAVALVIAVAVATLEALYPSSTASRWISSAMYVIGTIPSFWIGLLLIYVFAMTLIWLPGNGPYPGPLSEGFGNWLVYMILPTATLVMPTVAGWSVLFRAAIEEALGSDYVRTARAQGYSDLRVLFRHVLRNSLLPVITIAGMSLPAMFNNIVVLELVFNMQGLGSALIGSMFAFNYSETVNIVLIIGMVSVAGNLVADILYAVADPRIKFS